MNREIKFRIWNGSQMEYNIMAGFLGTFFVNSIDERDSSSMSQNNTKYPPDTIPMQFTGLKDINGKDIYENDIVQCGYGKAKVIFKSGCFMVQWIEDKEAYMEFLFSRKGMYIRKDDEQFTIIGDIYQNPELYEKL